MVLHHLHVHERRPGAIGEAMPSPVQISALVLGS